MGSVTASFREGPDQKAYAFWSIINRFTESEGWQDPFPSEIKFTESKLVTWPEGDHRLTPGNPETGDIAASSITNNLVPYGEHLEPYLEDFETNVGYTLQYDTMWELTYFTQTTTKSSTVNMPLQKTLTQNLFDFGDG